MELVLDLYSEEYVNNNELPNTKEDMLYQKELLKNAEKYPIKKITLRPDYFEDFEYFYIFETETPLDYYETDKIETELNNKMREYAKKLGFKRRKYAILRKL
ncbi:MAG: hypothetical protein BZ137_06040 [Methanosphaera sp. rholeuAM130]|nr:hypothetical protein [Methanosphaera sp.]RAP53726.1 MAG: hypothetical protein BZ137_06040 [Methanosphaera sp. rholeuAM130]